MCTAHKGNRLLRFSQQGEAGRHPSIPAPLLSVKGCICTRWPGVPELKGAHCKALQGAKEPVSPRISRLPKAGSAKKSTYRWLLQQGGSREQGAGWWWDCEVRGQARKHSKEEPPCCQAEPQISSRRQAEIQLLRPAEWEDLGRVRNGTWSDAARRHRARPRATQLLTWAQSGRGLELSLSLFTLENGHRAETPVLGGAVSLLSRD